MVQDSIQDSGGDHITSEHLSPLFETFITSKYKGGIFIAFTNELEEEISSLLIHGHVSLTLRKGSPRITWVAFTEAGVARPAVIPE